jgi:hypothetical protein
MYPGTRASVSLRTGISGDLRSSASEGFKGSLSDPNGEGSLPKNEEYSIIALDKFILATRDSGYKGTQSAVSELVDNALQAEASEVNIWIKGPEEEDGSLLIAVQDNGHGMDSATLRNALRFGGSTRFDDRTGIGRYGMGLPNSSFSQARRFEVYSWRNGTSPIGCYLDLDEIAASSLTSVPRPTSVKQPPCCPSSGSRSGTTVVWRRCDRLDHRKVSTLARKMTWFLGRVFRYYLWRGVTITINNEPVRSIDPLFLKSPSFFVGAREFGEEIKYEMKGLSAQGGDGPVGTVTVRFAELPVEEWHALPNDEKRRMGITDQPVISVVRGEREIDRGWFFMGSKRRENYDDWWRCEIRFDPVLDERFGITHTKQQIHPTQELLDVLVKDLETIGRSLNLRVRQAHQNLKSRTEVAKSEERAAAEERTLTPLPPSSPAERRRFTKVIGRSPLLKKWASEQSNSKPRYAIFESQVDSPIFYDVVRSDGRLAVLVNRSHAFYKRVYAQLSDTQNGELKDLRTKIDLILLAAARSEELATTTTAKRVLNDFRVAWSNTLANYLRT